MKNIVLIACAAAFMSCGAAQKENPNHIRIGSAQELFDWFRYSPDRDIVISGHRGGMEAGYPENCIESFERTLSYMQSFFEIDPRLTKDSVIVLMHDRTLDRTTTGTGRLADYTYAELQQLRLLDPDGKETPFKIPTLKDCIEWGRGKTVFNLDIKDVPLDFMSDFVASLDAAPHNLMYTVHNPEHVRVYLSRNPDAMFSVHCKNMDEFRAYDQAGMPWGQAMVYVGRTMTPDNAELYNTLHSLGVMIMISVAPTHDKLASETDRIGGYLGEIAKRPDVIETDWPYLFRIVGLSKRNI